MTRLTEKQLDQLLARKGIKAKQSKYRNKQITIDGMRFDSIAEGAYYQYLKLLVESGQVQYFLRQVPFHLPGRTVYRVDFQVFYSDRVEYVDVKGAVTQLFKVKKRQVEELYPVKIRCLMKKGTRFVEKTI